MILRFDQGYKDAKEETQGLDYLELAEMLSCFYVNNTDTDYQQGFQRAIEEELYAALCRHLKV